MQNVDLVMIEQGMYGNQHAIGPAGMIHEETQELNPEQKQDVDDYS